MKAIPAERVDDERLQSALLPIHTRVLKDAGVEALSLGEGQDATTDACVVPPVTSATGEGFKVQDVLEACGPLHKFADEVAIRRLECVGAGLISVNANTNISLPLSTISSSRVQHDHRPPSQQPQPHPHSLSL